MKIIEKIAFVIFSYLALILGILAALLVFGWLNLGFFHNIVQSAILNQEISTIILIVSVIFILVSIKCIFFSSIEKEESRQKEGIILENSDGRLLISKDTLESLIASVAKGFNGAENVNSRVYVDKENNLSVYVTLYVHQDAVIKDLSSNLQTKIKEAIRKTSDLEVKEVNIKVKNIAPEKNIIEE